MTATAPVPTLSPRAGARVAWAGAAAILTLATAIVALRWVNRGADPPGADWLIAGLAATLGFGTLGALLCTRRPENPIGWIATAVGLSFGVGFLAEEWAVLALLTRPGEVPGATLAEWLRAWTWVPGYALIPTLTLALLPDGRLPSPRWRPLVPASIAAIALATAALMVAPYGALDGAPLSPASANPVGIAALEDVAGLMVVPLAVCAVAGVTAFAVRVRRSAGVERQQLRWIGAGVAVAVALMLAAQVAGGAAVAPWALALALLVLPASVGVAILRHGLWELRPAVRRSLVAGALGLCVAAIYGGVVAVLGHTTGGGLVGTAIVAVAVLPLHTGLERAVNRLLYGVRDEPWAEVRRLDAALRRSREQLVLAREEERRRLRNDLHDELGPALAMLAMRLDAACDEAPEAAPVLRDLAAQAREGLAEVRRIVHDLRPPALDDLGLAGALAERLPAAIALLVPAPLGPLPAAVEVAAYRIVLEGVANASRHAPGRRCEVTLGRVGGDLRVTVADDGDGPAADAAAGVGLASIRARAEELGGSFAILAAPGGGTRLEVRLPCAS